MISETSAYDLMRQIEQDYQKETRLNDRKDYSIFYGPLLKSSFAVVDQNPGGNPVPDGYRIVDVMNGQHELVEGRNSGPTTRKQAQLLMRLTRSSTPDGLRKIQKINRYFRRGAGADKKAGMREAAPYLKRILAYIEPKLLVVGGAGIRGREINDFARVMGGSFRLDEDSIILGPNGTHEALYFCTGNVSIPGLRPMRVIGTYHPSKWHETFYKKAYAAMETEFKKIAG
jgi:hypothetical protein